MDLDSQSKSRYLDWESKPRFSVGRELATLITSCGILQKAWEEICNVSKNGVEFSKNNVWSWEEINIVSENNVAFFLQEDEGVAYVTFPSFSTQDFLVTDSRYGEYNIKNETIFSVCLKGENNKPALVHKGALNRFQSIRTSLKAKMQGLKAKTIIFVGHSMGGAVATLATLWYLQKKARNISYFCITFGSPLVGNAVLGEAIGREDWTGKFCHVVSKYDIVPRLLLAPFKSIAKHLNELVPHWWRIMATDFVAETHPSIPSLLQEILQCTSTIADNYPGESGLTSPYRPFGTYMFCSTQGAACIDNSEAVLKMLRFAMQGMPSDQLAGTYHTGYGKILEALTNDLLNATLVSSSTADSFEIGIALELEAMAVGAQNPQAFSALKEAGEKKNEQDLNIASLNNDLSKNQSFLAEVEWYKARCKEDSGYYDCFKKDWEKPKHHVNLARESLKAFWEGIVEMEKKHVLPSDFRCQNKWINAGTAYRRLIEPLDIAHYYRTRKDTKSYLSERPHHHRVLQKWMEDKEKTRTVKEKKNRTKFASLTLDSCFWAHLEDACQALPSLPQERNQHQVINAPLQESREFENRIWRMIKDKSISAEVFLKESSFMIWWEDYSRFKSIRDLSSFIENEGWK